MAAIMEARGKKSTDRAGQVETLIKLSEVAVSTYQEIRVLLALLAVRFDYNTTALTHMPQDQWNAAREHIDKLLEIVTKDGSYTIEEETEEYDDQIDRLPNQNGEGAVVKVRGSIISFVDRLDDEFTKSLQNIDPHTPEYVERLSDEKRLYATMIRAQHYFELRTQEEQLDRVVMRRLEHVYAKQEVITQALEAASSAAYAAHGNSKFAPPRSRSRKKAVPASSFTPLLCGFTRAVALRPSARAPVQCCATFTTTRSTSSTSSRATCS